MGNGGPGAGIAMNTDGIEAHAAKLEDIGVALSQDYRIAANKISANLGAIGVDELLSQAFRATHDAPAHQARGDADKHLGAYALLSAAGKDSAAGYLAANRSAERGMPRAI
jgi:hypothetical protein